MANTNPGAKIFGREPALWGGLINTAVYVLGATVFHLSTKQESIAIAVTAAVLGFAVALATHDGVSAAILGLVKAVFAVGLGYGLKLDADKQAFLLSAAATLSAMFVRTQATARVPATVTVPGQTPAAAQPHAAQPQAAQPHAAQPHAAQPHAAQPHAAQPQVPAQPPPAKQPQPADQPPAPKQPQAEDR